MTLDVSLHFSKNKQELPKLVPMKMGWIESFAVRLKLTSNNSIDWFFIFQHFLFF